MTILKGSQNTRNSVSKFTLIELLVVVAILAVLMSLLLPALARAKFHANLATCIGNQKQQAVAIMSYAGDYDEWYPAMPPGEYNGTAVYGRIKPWGSAWKTGAGPASRYNPQGMWEYLGLDLDRVGEYVDKIPSVLQCAQGTKEAGWYHKETGGWHSAGGRGFYGWYFDTWGGIVTPGARAAGSRTGMMRKVGDTFTTGSAFKDRSHQKLKFNVIASDIFKSSGLGGVGGASTNHIWGGDRHYVNGVFGTGHMSYGPLYFNSITGKAYSAWTFDDGRVEVYGPIPATQVPDRAVHVNPRSYTSSGGWNIPISFAVKN